MSNPFGMDPKDPLPDYDGPDIDTDEVERAVQEDLKDRADEFAEVDRTEEEEILEAARAPLFNGTMWLGLAISGVGLLLTAASYFNPGELGTSTLFTGLLVTGLLVFGKGFLFR